jgi:hypothetical protein
VAGVDERRGVYRTPNRGRLPTMGRLVDDQNHSYPLGSRVLIGRGPAANLRLRAAAISSEHAALRWTGADWELRDLGSRNGTFVDGARLAPGEPKIVAEGARLGFGAASGYVLAAAGPPSAHAVPIDAPPGQPRWIDAVDGLLALPSAEDPAAVVFESAPGRFVVEVDGGQRLVEDGSVVVAAGRSFRLALPLVLEGTAAVDVPTLDTVELWFGVSRDEETVRVTLVSRGRRISLEAREHAYVLLTLARQRVADRALPPSEQGWVDRDRLLKMLNLDANGMNVMIYRARGQLAAAGIEGAAGIVEVRRSARRLGVEPERIRIGDLDSA